MTYNPCNDQECMFLITYEYNNTSQIRFLYEYLSFYEIKKKYEGIPLTICVSPREKITALFCK